MPELPDIAVYIEALHQRVFGANLTRVTVKGPFLLRTVAPAIQEAEGKRVTELRRIGKRIAIGLEGDLWLVLHLMIAGRLHWAATPPKAGGKHLLASFQFSTGCLSLTEAGSQHRASLHLVCGEEGLHALDPGGLEPLTATLAEFTSALQAENHTIKRVLTDPRVFSGIGNAYSDEILHKAQLSPVLLSQRLTETQIAALLLATKQTLEVWMNLLRLEAAGAFPEKVTAFREGMAVHGRYGLPCPVCAAKVQRIRYASNETNYCPTCQTNGKLLADRSLSRLLKQDWPKTAEELELLTRAK